MSIEIQLVKIEPEDVPAQSKEDNEVNSNLNMEQPECATFVGIKQEVEAGVEIKVEPQEYDDDAYERGDMDPEGVLLKLEHHLYESNETIKLPRARTVSYKDEDVDDGDDDSDEDYRPYVKTGKKKYKKLSNHDSNVKSLLKSRPRITSKDEQTYSDEITSQIDIVTIDEETRQIEHHEALGTRKHMNYICDHCALGFVVQEAYQMHLKIHSPEAGAHECDICKVRLKTVDMLYQHKLRHYRRYRCTICQLQQRDKDTVAAHIMAEHMGIAFSCQHCGRDFKRPQYLNRHIKQMHTKPLHLECPVCQRVFHERGWYRCHVRTHNEQVRKSITRKVICSHCGREFRNKQYLIRHLAVHEDRRPKTCNLCSRTFKNSEVLRVHKRQHHALNPVRLEKVPYTLAEKQLLIELVRERPIIEDQHMNAKNIESKRQAWHDLAIAFNAQPFTSQRSEVQLKRCFKKMKWRKRKELAQKAREMIRAGRGWPDDGSSGSDSALDVSYPYIDLKVPDDIDSSTNEMTTVNMAEQCEVHIDVKEDCAVNIDPIGQTETNVSLNGQCEIDEKFPSQLKMIVNTSRNDREFKTSNSRTLKAQHSREIIKLTVIKEEIMLQRQRNLLQFEKESHRLQLEKLHLEIDLLKKQDYASNEIRLPRFSADTTCSVCGRILTTPAMLTRHMQRMHTERIKKFQCDYCQKGFYSKAEVRSHIEWTHLQQRKHACACGRVFRSPALLRDHALTKHLNIHQPRDKACTVCGKMFANQQVLTRHVKSHSGETYPCAECGQKFKTQSYVKVHYKIKHLNMTRAQVKAQSRRKLIMVHSEESMNAKIKVNKKSKANVEDPLNLDNFVKEKLTKNLKKDNIKVEVVDAPVPLFETFVDIQREC